MSKILIHNFDYPVWVLGNRFYRYSDNSWMREHGNVRIISEGQNNKEQAASDIVSALLIYDKLCINIDNFMYIIQLFGFEDTKLLLTNNIIEIIDDGPSEPIIIKEGIDRSKLTSITSIDDIVGRYEPFSTVESTLKDLFQKNSSKIKLNENEINYLLIQIERHGNQIYDPKISIQRYNEMKYDFENKNLTRELGISSKDIRRIADRDIFKLLRLTNLNRGLLNMSQIHADGILIDSIVGPMLRAKVSPALEAAGISSSVDIFQNIMSQKGIPDLGRLYLKGVISLHDIIEFRENLDGRLFRNWLASSDYDQEKIIRTLLNKSLPSIHATIIKYLRWLYPNIIGVASPFSGIALDYLDSFIVERILQGWHPSMFLDDKVRFKVQRKMEMLEKVQLQANIRQRFPNVGRNDLCPCGSGKKFKSCCGIP